MPVTLLAGRQPVAMAACAVSAAALRFAKLGKVRFTSHRDVARMWERALRRAELPVAYSRGLLAPARSCPSGWRCRPATSRSAEYLDIDLGRRAPRSTSTSTAGGLARRRRCPTGIDVMAAVAVDAGHAVAAGRPSPAARWLIERRRRRPARPPPTAVDAALAADRARRHPRAQGQAGHRRPPARPSSPLEAVPARRRRRRSGAVARRRARHPAPRRCARPSCSPRSSPGVEDAPGASGPTNGSRRDGARREPLAARRDVADAHAAWRAHEKGTSPMSDAAAGAADRAEPDRTVPTDAPDRPTPTATRRRPATPSAAAAAPAAAGAAAGTGPRADASGDADRRRRPTTRAARPRRRGQGAVDPTCADQALVRRPPDRRQPAGAGRRPAAAGEPADRRRRRRPPSAGTAPAAAADGGRGGRGERRGGRRRPHGPAEAGRRRRPSRRRSSSTTRRSSGAGAASARAARSGAT